MLCLKGDCTFEFNAFSPFSLCRWCGGCWTFYWRVLDPLEKTANRPIDEETAPHAIWTRHYLLLYYLRTETAQQQRSFCPGTPLA